MSVTLMQLWLPILLSGVFCWIASAIFHMVIKHHNADYKQLANEDQVAEAMNANKPAPGLYNLPYCIDMKDMADENMIKKFDRGPVAMIAVFNDGMPPMGKLLGQQILFFVVTCVLLAWVTTMVVPVGAAFMAVFKFMLPTAFLAFGWALIPFSIWMGQPWSNCVRFLIDALFYGAITAATFAWLWPSAA